MENMDQGITMFDDDLNIVMYNQRALDILELPQELLDAGSHLETLFRYNAERGDYGPGDVDEQVQSRVALARKFEAHKFERTRPDGRVIEIRGNPVKTEDSSLPHKIRKLFSKYPSST